MDAAQFQQALQAMQQQQQAQQQAQAQQHALIQALQQQLLQQQAAAAVIAPRGPQPRLAPPPMYGGSAHALDAWVREMRKQCDFYALTTADARIRFFCAQLTGAALDWWSAQTTEQRAAHSATEDAFVQALRARFQPVNSADTARRQLDELQQGPRQSVHEYISAFRRLLSAVPDMSDADRTHRFLQGLRPALQTQLRIHGVDSLDDAITKAARIGSLSQFAAGAAAASHLSATAARGDAMDVSNLELHGIEGLESPTTGEDEPSASHGDDVVSRSELRQLLQQQHQQLLAVMQQRRGGQKGKPAQRGRGGGGSTIVPGLTDEQVRQRYIDGQCFACGQSGHRKADCPSKQKN